MDTIKKNKEILTDGSKEVGLEIYMLLSHHQNLGQIQDIETDRLKMCHC
jgi:hypothetical protein